MIQFVFLIFFLLHSSCRSTHSQDDEKSSEEDLSKYTKTEHATGGNEVGNGGDVVYCPNSNSRPKLQMLDLYEAEILRSIKIKIAESDPIQAVSNTIQLIKDFDNPRYQQYLEWLNHFFEESTFIEEIQLVDIPDSQHLVLPANCKILQIAVQREPQLPGDKYYTINKTIWDYLNNIDKAVLVLHEIVYRDAINQGHGNSIFTRYFVAWLLNHNGQELNFKKYLSELENVNFNIILNDIAFEAKNLKFWDMDKKNVKSGTLAYKTSLEVAKGSKIDLEEKTIATFHENGVLSSGYIDQSFNGRFWFKFDNRDSQPELLDRWGFSEFDSNGYCISTPAP